MDSENTLMTASIMKEQTKKVDDAYWKARTNIPDIYTKGRVRFAAGLREIVNEFQYYQCCKEEGVEDMVVDARVLYDLADELETWE